MKGKFFPPDCAPTSQHKSCNQKYVGGMICRAYYLGDSACTEFGGKMHCLIEMQEQMQETATIGLGRIV